MKTLPVLALRFSTLVAVALAGGSVVSMPAFAQQIQMRQAGAPSDHLPIITAQPLSQNVREGARVNFTVIATGQGELTYRWYRGTQLLNNGNGNSPSLIIPTVKLEDTGSYHVEVSNAAGAVTSGVAQLTVNALPPPVAAAPTITLQPTALVVNNGATAIFSVTASGAAVLEYQWMKDGMPIGGATSPTLALTNVKIMDAATYSVRVSNSAGTITSTPVTLTVNVAVSLVMDQQ